MRKDNNRRIMEEDFAFVQVGGWLKWRLFGDKYIYFIDCYNKD